MPCLFLILGEYSQAAHVLSSNQGMASSTHYDAASSSSLSSDSSSLGQINLPQKNLTPLGIYLRAFSLTWLAPPSQNNAVVLNRNSGGGSYDDTVMYHFKANENAIAIIEKLANGNNAAMAEDEEDGSQGVNGNGVASLLAGFFDCGWQW